jgi:transposase
MPVTSAEVFHHYTDAWNRHDASDIVATFACDCCGIERKEIGTCESWQMDYLPGHFERIHHLRKKYACPSCERNGNNPQMETAAKPEMAIDKGMAGPGLLAYIATSKFSDYVPLYLRQQCLRARDEACRSQSQKHPLSLAIHAAEERRRSWPA